MAFTEITIIAPSSAAWNESVQVELKVKNTWSSGFYVYAVGILDTSPRFIDWERAWIGAGETRSFYGQFQMPAYDAAINAYTYYEASDGLLYGDAEKSKGISIKTLGPAEFRSLTCSYSRA